MERTEDDMKFVGFFGMFKRSFKTIFNCKKIFAQITLTLILPLTIIFLAPTEISRHFFRRTENSYIPYDTNDRRETVTDWLYYCLFEVAYYTILAVFSLLPTAAVVFTIASVYTDREVVFRSVMKIVPKVWKRSFVTFAFIYIELFIYNVINDVALLIIRSKFAHSLTDLSLMFFIVEIAYVIGFLYLSVVWQLASVVTVLENIHGVEALKKGKMLANGKKKVGMGIALVLYAIFSGLLICYVVYDVIYGDEVSNSVMVESGVEVSNSAMTWRVMMIGILVGIMLMMLILLFILMQTILYLVCKSYHREAIDKLSLSSFLGAYMGETVVCPNSGEEIELGRAQPPPVAQQI